MKYTKSLEAVQFNGRRCLQEVFTHGCGFRQLVTFATFLSLIVSLPFQGFTGCGGLPCRAFLFSSPLINSIEDK